MCEEEEGDELEKLLAEMNLASPALKGLRELRDGAKNNAYQRIRDTEHHFQMQEQREMFEAQIYDLKQEMKEWKAMSKQSSTSTPPMPVMSVETIKEAPPMPVEQEEVVNVV